MSTAAAGLLLAGCGGGGPAPAYKPQVREVTITAVPLLVREQAHLFPFLTADFAAGGVLEGREVYAFVPSTITAIQGDTLHLTVINPEDDLHSFVLPGLSLALPGQQTAHATYVARTPGIFAFTCNIPAHLPMMWGQLVVLSPRAVEVH
jgi:uncharacterized cupredoxin-like copper-binding protein